MGPSTLGDPRHVVLCGVRAPHGEERGEKIMRTVKYRNILSIFTIPRVIRSLVQHVCLPDDVVPPTVMSLPRRSFVVSATSVGLPFIVMRPVSSV